MQQPLTQAHLTDENGNPAGGNTLGRGIRIDWQNGPLRIPGSSLNGEANGAFVEDVIAAAVGRLEHYQGSKFRCSENALAIGHLNAALEWLASRTADREARGVEGTHEA